MFSAWILFSDVQGDFKYILYMYFSFSNAIFPTSVFTNILTHFIFLLNGFMHKKLLVCGCRNNVTEVALDFGILKWISIF